MGELMPPLSLHEFHQQINGRFGELNGTEIVTDYGEPETELTALSHSAGVLDLSFRGRICLVGADRVRFLHGQVTNDVKRLQFGEGCYAAITTTKGKIQSDLNIYALKDELLLDFEPGLAGLVTERLERFVVADDVQVVDVAAHYGLLSVQGPASTNVIRGLEVFTSIPEKRFQFVSVSDATWGEIYLMNRPRLNSAGFDLFVPTASLGAVADRLIAAARAQGGRAVGWNAFETARIVAGVPRFGADMDESHLAQECGIETAAISYNKGCYIGQEVINRIHSIGHVNRSLCRLTASSEMKELPPKGTALTAAGTEVGNITSAAGRDGTIHLLGYVRREANQTGAELTLTLDGRDYAVRVAGPPVV